MKEDRNHLTAPRVLTFLTFVFLRGSSSRRQAPEGFRKNRSRDRNHNYGG
jgi:hypothetical protein